MRQQQPFYPDEEEWDYYEGEYEEYLDAEAYYFEEEYYEYPLEYPTAPAYAVPDMGILIGITILLFFAFVAIKNGGTSLLVEDAVANALAALPATSTPSGDPLSFAAPYTNYALTQGPHGQSYGHLAIDLAAGRGTPVLSPINGVITGNYTDQYGNTTLVIENEVYRVLLLHGDYFLQVGNEVKLGDQVGTESNHGYTTDMAGNRCFGREYCGNHTHLNVFDKRTGANANPLDLIP